MKLDVTLTFAAVVVISAAVIFSLFVHAFKPSVGTEFTPTCKVLNEHIPYLESYAMQYGLLYGNFTAPIWLIYYVSPYDDANYTLANVFNQTLLNMVYSGKVALFIMPNLFTSKPSGINVTDRFLPLLMCSYRFNSTAALEFLKWFSLQVRENATLASNITTGEMLSVLRSLGVNVNYTECFRLFNESASNYELALLNTLAWAYGELGYAPSLNMVVPPNNLVVVGINTRAGLAVVDENIAGYTPPMVLLAENLMAYNNTLIDQYCRP